MKQIRNDKKLLNIVFWGIFIIIITYLGIKTYQDYQNEQHKPQNDRRPISYFIFKYILLVFIGLIISIILVYCVKIFRMVSFNNDKKFCLSYGLTEGSVHFDKCLKDEYKYRQKS
jgi:uncharacterized BrkB/YihY/UPF0761 family membrane protein